MTYAHQHLFQWLKNHSCISISKLETTAGVTKDALRHFLKERRALAEINFIKAEKVLLDYGYTPFESE